MFVEFNTMPDSSKIWIYQGSEFMSEKQVNEILDSSKKFIESWTAHQANLKASVTILENLFIVIAVDESFNQASGCSIDTKVHFIKKLESETGINFFDRLRIAFIDKDIIRIEPVNKLTSLLASNQISQDTVVFDNLVDTLGSFKNRWKTSVRNSWVAGVI